LIGHYWYISIFGWRTWPAFSSPELKAQVSFSDRPLSSVRLSVRRSVYPSVNFYIFDFFSRTTGPILTLLGTNHPWVKGIHFCSKEGDSHSPRLDNTERVKIHWFFFKSSPLEPAGQIQSNLVQIILGWRKFNLVQIKCQVLFKGEIITKMQKWDRVI
jgi:hypothetical protein